MILLGHNLLDFLFISMLNINSVTASSLLILLLIFRDCIVEEEGEETSSSDPSEVIVSVLFLFQ